MAALSLTATGFADPGKENKAKKHGKYTFTVTTTDNGSCGQPWANDVVRRTFHVKKNKDGSYTLTRRDRGAFTTIGGASPGSCDTTGNHGTHGRAWRQGEAHRLHPGDGHRRDVQPERHLHGARLWVHRRLHHDLLRVGRCQFSCFTNSADCRFNFNYTAPAKANSPLRYRHWQDKGKGAGTMLKEEFSGDIATV